MATPNLDGLDVSHWNLVLDESRVPSLPLMSCKATEGDGFTSPKFDYFWKLFKAKGARYRGAYHWIRSSSTPAEQVAHFAKQLKAVGGLERGDLIQLDWEPLTDRVGNTIDPGPSLAQVEEWIARCTDMFGPRVIVYSSDWVPHFQTWRDRNPDVPVWYANYRVDASKPANGWAECDRWNAAVWQWSSTYPVSGFAAGIDVNHVFDWSVLDALTDQSPQEVDVLLKVKTPPAGSPGWWPYLGLFDSGAVRPMVNDDVGAPRDGTQQLTDIGQYRRLAVAAGVDLTNEFPTGTTSVTVKPPVVNVPPFPTKYTVTAEELGL